MTDTTAPPGPPRAVATPCVKVCIVDPESSLCLGCFRTLPEIGGWSRFSDEERARLMAELPTRRARIRPEKLSIFAPPGPPSAS
ncbi:MAG: DUF1289 domain-containing protein [Caulobacter sp.]|nr:DUF1289 domain-containing protein [Caulobacter sp.]